MQGGSRSWQQLQQCRIELLIRRLRLTQRTATRCRRQTPIAFTSLKLLRRSFRHDSIIFRQGLQHPSFNKAVLDLYEGELHQS